MLNTPTIRRAAAADVPALAVLVGEYWQLEQIEGFDEAHIRRLLASFLATPHLGCAWIAEDGSSRPVGYLIAVYVFSLEHEGLTAEIDEFYLQAEARGGGVGGRLLEIAEEELVRAGCTNVALQLGRTNDAARAFYRRCGYRDRDAYELLDKSLK
jgi:GNAT superfamily N-acetyltransferase